MRRAIKDPSQFTPFGLWIYENCKPNMMVSNLDYILHDYCNNKLLLLEEKQSNGQMGDGQRSLFILLDKLLRYSSEQFGFDYWGFYVLRFPENKTMPGIGMVLNNIPITVEQLASHLNFENKFCEGWWAKNKVPTPLQVALKAYNKLSDSDKAAFHRLIGA